MTSAKAAIEQMSSGQIGQPAACMIESNQSPLPLTVRIGGTGGGGLWRVVRVDNFVDNRVCATGCTIAETSHGAGAASFSSEKMFEINELARRCAALRGKPGSPTSNGAAVELSLHVRCGAAHV